MRRNYQYVKREIASIVVRDFVLRFQRGVDGSMVAFTDRAGPFVLDLSPAEMRALVRQVSTPEHWIACKLRVSLVVGRHELRPASVAPADGRAWELTEPVK